ncbi:MAG TPA: DinB family protein [Thermoanaerobaculia bacterium]|nr:DinB family protein [Thermoanaerobaculia bacterium]
MARTAKQTFLATYDREHATTMRVLRAYPTDKLDLRPQPAMKSARELAWVFVIERGLGMKVWNDELAQGVPVGSPPAVPDDWNALLAALEGAHAEFRTVIDAAPESMLSEKVHFLIAPKTMGEISRLTWLWFLLHDEIHHRGQFSIYLRMAGGKVPSIYGPTADEPWM